MARKLMKPGTLFSITVPGEEMRATVISDNGHDIDVWSHDATGDNVEKWKDEHPITIISEPSIPTEAILANTLRDIGAWMDANVSTEVEGSLFHRKQIREVLKVTGFES